LESFLGFLAAPLSPGASFFGCQQAGHCLTTPKLTEVHFRVSPLNELVLSSPSELMSRCSISG
jgi:hypothetical protein